MCSTPVQVRQAAAGHVSWVDSTTLVHRRPLNSSTHRARHPWPRLLRRKLWLLVPQSPVLLRSHVRIRGQNGWPLPLSQQQVKSVVVLQAQATLQQALAWPLFRGRAMAAGWLATMQPQSSSWNSLRSLRWGRRRPGSPKTQVGSPLDGADVYESCQPAFLLGTRHRLMVMRGICAGPLSAQTALKCWWTAAVNAASVRQKELAPTERRHIFS